MPFCKHTLHACAVLFLLANSNVHADAVGFNIGTHGIAIDYQKAISNKLNARFIISDMPLSTEIEEEDIKYELEYDRTNIGILLDYHPMAGAFHLTAGLHILDNNLNLEATSNNGQYDIGDNTYTSNNLELKAKIAFAKASPYLGLGWGNTIGGTGLSGNIDLGILYAGKPSASLDASGTVSNGVIDVNVRHYAAFQQDLEKERADLEDELKNFNVLPIIQFGLIYKF
jgi:hypothetical protein